MRLKPVIWGIQFIMVLIFLFFSFFPLLYTLSSLIVFQFPILVILLIIMGLITIYGIFTLNLGFRGLSTGYLSLGVIFSVTDGFILSFGVVISWLFYETWLLAWKFRQLDWEYLPYASDSPEQMKLRKLFQSQLISLSLLAWISLTLSWGVLFIAQTFYVQLGSAFGTLGVSISLALLFLLYLVSRYVRDPHFGFQEINQLGMVGNRQEEEWEKFGKT